MQDSPQLQSPDLRSTKRRTLKRAAMVTLLGGLLVGLGVQAFGNEGAGGNGHGWRHHGFDAADPESTKLHIEYMVKRLLVGTDASDAQRAKITEIVNAALTDLRPVHDKHQAARKAGLEILSKPTIDRAALETLRTEQIGLADTASKRITAALADVAEVLTPEQRSAVAQRIQQHRSGHHS
jgi:periplasmic protein CpxP/Spy